MWFVSHHGSVRVHDDQAARGCGHRVRRLPCRAPGCRGRCEGGCARVVHFMSQRREQTSLQRSQGWHAAWWHIWLSGGEWIVEREVDQRRRLAVEKPRDEAAAGGH